MKAGLYATPNDVVMAAMDAFSRQEAQQAAFADLKSKIRAGIESANNGELSDGDEFFAGLERDEQQFSSRSSEA